MAKLQLVSIRILGFILVNGIFSCLFLALIAFSCTNKKSETTLLQADSVGSLESINRYSSELKENRLETNEDSIRNDYGISDSITLIRKIYIEGEAQYAFIIHNNNTHYHDNFQYYFGDFDEFETEQYNNIYRNRREEYSDSILISSSMYNDLITEWVNVYKYKNSLYVFNSCGFQRRRQLTDTTFIDYLMDGAYPDLILSVKRYKNEIAIKTTRELLRFKLIDAKKSIYLFSDGDTYGEYIIPLKKVRELPIILEYCTEDGVDLVGFDKIKYE